MALDDKNNASPAREGDADDHPLADLQDAVAAGLDDVEHGRTTEGRDAIDGVRARRVYCRGCAGRPVHPVHVGDVVWCAYHLDQGPLPRTPTRAP